MLQNISNIFGPLKKIVLQRKKSIMFFTKILSSTTVFSVDNNCHVTLKTGVMLLKIELCIILHLHLCI